MNSEHVPLDKPSVARMYDYFLGGHHNFEIDRETARKIIEVAPEAPLVMRANRAFLRRAVTWLVDQGIDQFLDIGSGVPTVGNVHEIAQRRNPEARIVYVDIDPVAVAHSEAMLHDNSRADVLQGDARNPDDILASRQVRDLLDLERPMAVLLISILQFVAEDGQLYNTVRVLRDAVPSGSYVAISHATGAYWDAERNKGVQAQYARTSNPANLRSREQIIKLFDGLELVEPGLVYVPLWRPDSEDDLFLDSPERSVNFAGIGLKP